MKFILHRRITIAMLFIALTLLGYVSYKQLPMELLPNAELPSLYVSVSSNQDLDPSYVEQEVIVPLEGAIVSVGGVDEMTSNIDSRQSTVEIQFQQNVDIQITSLKLEDRINEFATTMPEGFTARVQKVDASRMTTSFMSLQVRGSGGVDRVRHVVDNSIINRLENIDGIASVSVFGGRVRAIEVQLDPDMCKALNLTASRIGQTLTQNTRERVFVGDVTEPDQKFFVYVNSLYTQVADLENIVVASGPIRLKDVATVFFDLKDETSYSRVNGLDAISVTLTNDAQDNLIELSHRTLDAIAQLNTELASQDVEIVVQENSAEVMEKNIDEIINLALSGGLLACLILWFFLKNLRLVVLISLSIPISVFTAFNFFYAAGISINSLTLVGMALAVGMLLDNSVVVLENVYRLSGNGESPEKAVLQGTGEVWRSIVAATLTTITVFLPFVFSDNFAIKLIGKHIGSSIISTLSVSLVVALLFVPMVTYVILRRKNNKSVFYERISVTQRPIQMYLVFLKSAMRHPGVTILGAVVALFVVLIMSLSLNIQEMRQVESDRFNVQITMPKGSTLDKTDAYVRVIETRLKDEIPECDEVVSRVNEEEASLTVILKEDFKKTYKRDIDDIRRDLISKLPETRNTNISINVTQGSGGGSSASSAMSGMANLLAMMGIGESSERIVVKGSDFDMIQSVASDMQYILNEQDYISNASISGWQGRQAEVLLDFDPVLLSAYNISNANIQQGLGSMTRQTSSGTSLKIGDDDYDIIIRNKEPVLPDSIADEQTNDEPTVEELRRVDIENADGGKFRLENLASLNYSRGRSRITRVNQDKQMVVRYSFTEDVTSSKSLLTAYRAEIDDYVAQYNLPSGVAIQVEHEQDMFGDFKFLMLAAFILIFMILASVFESFTTPFVLLFTVPLAAIGSLLALLLTDNPLLNANTLTGFLILLGVVVNNGIILIDYSNILRKRGYRRNRALMMAGLSRLRPILITSITTIIAMLPLAMGDSEYSGAIGAPFAITVIGGLSFSALLTLVFIPTVCMALENALAWYRSLSKKIWILHLALFLAAVFAIYQYSDGVMWQSVYLVAVLILIPGLTFFIQSSLRSANAKVIDPNESIRISVRNLVKIYDRPDRFSRQWQSGLLIRQRLGLAAEFHSLKDLLNIAWLFALWGFLIYFTYFYLEKGFWIFILSFAVYGLTLNLWRKVRKYLFYRFDGSRSIKLLNRIIFWSIPPVIWWMMLQNLGNAGFVILIGIVWALAISVYATSSYLYVHDVNIERVTGRMANLRKSWFRLVKKIPLIGKRCRPFKALRGVSCDIQTGMFGLLGPNGAGKSTMMRIICGILEQSYGSIWINGLDTRVYREELQGLIGFLPQEFGTYENMTAWEFLDYQAILKGVTDKPTREQRIEYVLQSVHMLERKDHKIGSFSGGMKQRVGIALILLHLPRILIVDEPTAGLDPRERIRFRNLLVELSKDRIVIFSTHIIEDISSSCNQVVVINKGELKYFGEPMQMVGMAAGKVWTFNIPKDEFEEQLDKSLVVHHIQNDDIIQVRYLSYKSPYKGAVKVEANLEDAYLCLLKNMN